MFTLTIYDRKGVELKEGDIIKISNGKEFDFFAEVKWLEKDQILTPFHTFSFHSFEKIDKLPNGVTKSTEERYNIWYLYHDDAMADKHAADFQEYLMSWRECEHHLAARMWRINKKK